MRFLLLPCLLFAPLATLAAPVGQTMHHCGYLKVTSSEFTSTTTSITAAEQQLMKLGYLDRADGVWGLDDRAGVSRFQADRNLEVSGVVTQQTASMLGYYAHPSKSVRSCYRPAVTR